ncbi:hypothetical protein BH10ACI1_BH10ACI1_00460 [soil metagenome]
MRKQTVRYRYDALGRRVQRFLVGGKENTKFIYDGLDVVMDDNFGTLTKYQNGLGIDNKLKMVTSGTAKYFLADHLGSTVGLTDSSGNISSAAGYDSFGNSTNNLTTRYQYTGREFDNFTGLQFSRARFYDGNLGRFISEDPIGFSGGDVNLFGYVSNNPVSRIDPFGLQDTDVIILNSPPFNNPESKHTPLSYNFGCSNSGLGLGGLADFSRNYSDMRTANTVGADKFFHCMANCQSSRKGSMGNLISNAIGEGREYFDEYIKGDSRKDCDEDRFANETGRFGGIRCQPCEEVCSQFRPKSLVYPIPTIDYGNYGDCGKYGNWRCK